MARCGEHNTEVVIVGAGPVGLTLAGELGRRGVRCVVIDPREHDRSLDVTALPPGDLVCLGSLAGEELARVPDFAGPSGSLPDAAIHVESMPTVERWSGWRAVAMSNDHHGVAVDIEPVIGVAPDSAVPTSIRARFAVGCDGADSLVRRAAAIRYQAPGFHRRRGVIFHAPDVRNVITGPEAMLYLVVDGAAPGVVRALGHDRWWFQPLGGPIDEDPDSFDAMALLPGVIGADVHIEVTVTRPWGSYAPVADAYAVGHLLVAGDAAHPASPTGSHHRELCLGDAADLGWKLAAVVRGWGGPDLLESYERERRPVAHRQAIVADANALALSSAATVVRNAPDRRSAARQALADLYPSTGWGGQARYAGSDHVPDEVTPDLGPWFTLVVGDASQAEVAPLTRAAGEAAVPFTVVRRPDARRILGSAMVLARPDGSVAWRGERPPVDAAAVLAALTGRPLPTAPC